MLIISKPRLNWQIVQCRSNEQARESWIANFEAINGCNQELPNDQNFINTNSSQLISEKLYMRYIYKVTESLKVSLG